MIPEPPPKKHQQHLILGFIGVLVLLLGLASAVLIRMSGINNTIRDTLAIQNDKAHQITLMRDAMRKRQVGLRDMVIESDPFIKDDVWLQYTDAASEFMTALQRLTALGISRAERTALDAVSRSATDAQAAQRRVVQMTREGIAGGEITALLQRAITAQDYAMTQMSRLFDIQQASGRQVVQRATQQFRQTVVLMLLLGAGALALAVTISILVVKRDRRLVQDLHSYHSHLEELVVQRTAELESSVQELKDFSYSLAHDLRQPLRGLDGFSLLLAEDYKDCLDEAGQDYLRRIRTGSQRMGHLLDGMLRLTHLSQHKVNKTCVNLSSICQPIVTQLHELDPQRHVNWDIADDMWVLADDDLMNILLQNLLSNSWKFTSKNRSAHIRFERYRDNSDTVYCVSDDGAGFDMRYADKLFTIFERLHSMEDFEGTGIGLATVARIIKHHNGKIWAHGEPGLGARISFTLGEALGEEM